MSSDKERGIWRVIDLPLHGKIPLTPKEETKLNPIRVGPATPTKRQLAYKAREQASSRAIDARKEHEERTKRGNEMAQMNDEDKPRYR